MTSLVKCHGTDCNKRSSCTRYTQESLPKYQAYLVMCVACKNPNDGCKWFISNGLENTVNPA